MDQTDSNSKDYYALLESEPVDSCSEILTKYRHLVLQSHPDKMRDKSENNERFIAISRAASILGDPVMRAKYDRWRSLGLSNVSFDEWLKIENNAGGTGHWRNPNPFTTRLLETSNNSEEEEESISRSDLMEKFKNYEL